MESMLFLGYVKHNRYVPTPHSFQYPLYVYGLNLSALNVIDKRNPLFGYNRLRLATISDKDYLDASPESIETKLRAQLERHNIKTPVASVMLITSARYLNYVFNPVSFYYCFSDKKGLVCIVAEVNNTYGEKHVYILDDDLSDSHAPVRKYKTEKVFHVSPFNKVDGDYFFYMSDINETLDIRIELRKNDLKVFDAQLYGRAVPFTFLNHAKLILKYPIVPHLSIPRIYVEAGKLYFQKKLEFNAKPVPLNPSTIRSLPATSLQNICMKFIRKLFAQITIGFLNVSLPDGEKILFGDSASKLKADMRIRDYNFFTRVVFGGDIGLGESYMDSEWDTTNLVDLFNVLIENRDLFSDGNFKSAVLSRLQGWLAHRNRRNNIFGSKKNIHYHYDLGNDFYQTFLDTRMVYSCAIFENDTDSLETAQQRKLSAMIHKAEIGREDHVLEIGCGWASFAIEASRQTGCRVTGVTISKAQYELACERVKNAGLDDRITILFQDYRHIKGRFDKIVSIEMLEAVGHEYFGTFFKVCDTLLKPGGRIALQFITIPDHRYDTYRRQRDWIQKHIFPGGQLPSVTALCQSMAKHTCFVIEHLENIGTHYARTLSEWRQRFLRQTSTLSAMGFDRTFMRKWIYYLSCCEAGFERRVLGDVQMVLSRAKKESD